MKSFLTPCSHAVIAFVIAGLPACSRRADAPVVPDTASVAIAPDSARVLPDSITVLHDSLPGPQDAVAVIAQYYVDIDAKRYRDAYQMWGDGGKASGKSFDEFAKGFRETSTVRALPGMPGRIEGAAGSRYVTIPVIVNAQTRSGTMQHFEGSYDLRYTVVDGATSEQRTWHIYAAHMKAR